MKARVLSLLFALDLAASAAGQSVLITEFKALNNGPLQDDFGNTSDWIELFNASPTNINLGGWFLTDDPNALARWSFPETNLPSGNFLVVFASGYNLRVAGEVLHTSFSLSGGGGYLALVRPDGLTVEQEFAPAYPPQYRAASYGFPMAGGRVLAGAPVFLEPTPGGPNPPASASLPLTITELMYHPAPAPEGSSFATEAFEYIELMNIGTNTLDLAGANFDAGVSFTFPEMMLPSGERVLVVANLTAFASRYGAGRLVAGAFTGTFSDSGERLALSGLNSGPSFDFTYRDSWHPATDGHGFSLVPANERGSAGEYANRASWRASTQRHGSPGLADPVSHVPPIYINEALTRPAEPYEDAIELFNPNTNDVDISGWFLTDDFDEPTKFRLPPGAVVPAGGFLALDAHSFNAPNDDPLEPGFGLGDFGEEIYLFSADAAGELTGYTHGFAFGTAEPNVTFGRHITSTGEEVFVPQTGITFLATNAGPKVGPVIISEIHYHPPDQIGQGSRRFEFIELRNITGQPLPLYDPAFPTNSWLLGDYESNTVAFAFPTGAVIAAGGYVIVAGFNPADPALLQNFTTVNHLAPGTPIHGPWTGQLNNAGSHLALLRPDAPELLFVPYLVVDAVRYANRWPWPVEADDTGASIHRLDEHAYGDDPVNWLAGSPAPGLSGLLRPALNRPLADQTVVVSSDVLLDATAVGSVPIFYQWRFNGLEIPGAHDALLRLTHVQPAHAGAYACLVSNAAAVFLTRTATLTVLDTNAPLVSVTSPAAPQVRVSSSEFTLAGTASDDALVSSVFVQHGSAPFLAATGTTNWSSAVNLKPGWNTIRCYAVDWAGNQSPTSTVLVHFQPDAARLGLAISGMGAVSGPNHGQRLPIGRTYTLRAKPAIGHFFSHWLDWGAGTTFSNPVLSFVMRSNLTFSAVFTPGPFIALAGSYDGLFQPETNPAHLNSGFVSLLVAKGGGYSGRLIYRGSSHPLHGHFGTDLAARQLIRRPGTNDLAVTLQLTPGSERVAGSVVGAGFVSAVRGHRTGFQDPASATNFAGRYSASLTTGSTTISTSAVSVAISATGRITLRGRLPDRNPVARTAQAADDGQSALYLPHYDGRGSAFGWLNFTNSPPDPLAASLLWSRTGARGFTNVLELRGHR